MSDFSLSRAERLRGEKAIARLFTQGKGGFTYPFRYFWRVTDNPEEGFAVAVMFSVPKKMFKRSVKRNLLKRRSREAYRMEKHAIVDAAVAAGKRIELALVYSSKEEEDLKTIENGIRRILATIRKGL